MGTTTSDLCHRPGEEPGVFLRFEHYFRCSLGNVLCGQPLGPTETDVIPLMWFAVGYRVLSVHAGSPGANTTVIHNGIRPLMKEERIPNHALVPYFDFIISINGKLLVRLNCPAPLAVVSRGWLSRVRITALSFKKSSGTREKSSSWRFSTPSAAVCEVGFPVLREIGWLCQRFAVFQQWFS
jgi:hypothetical protein